MREKGAEEQRSRRELLFLVPNPQSPIPSPQSPIPNPQSPMPQFPIPNLVQMYYNRYSVNKA
jgi:hypothetical protein